MGSNKWRSIRPQTVQATAQASRDPLNLEGTMSHGLWTDRAPKQLEMATSPDLDRVRVERRGMRQDFGSVLLGDPASGTILAQGEHRFVRAGTLFRKHFRMYLNGSSQPVIQSYSGGTWTTEVTGAFTTEAVFHVWESYFNLVFFVPVTGGTVFVWDQSDLVQNVGDDFSATNLIGGYGGTTTSATVNPAGGTGDQYRAHYSFRMRGINIQEGGSAKVRVLYNGSVLGERIHALPVNMDNSAFDYQIAHETIDFEYPLPNNAVVSLTVAEISSFPFPLAQQEFTVAGSNIEATLAYVLFKSVANQYTVQFHMNQLVYIPGTTTGVRISADYGAGYVPLYSGQHGFGGHSVIVFVTDRPQNFKIELFEVVDDSEWSLMSFPDANLLIRDETVLVEVHGFVTAEDGTAGITYNTNGTPVNTLSQVYKDAPENTILLTGTYVTNFADRIIVLQNDGDFQKVVYTASEKPLDWLGIGSGELILRSRSDPIDSLIAFKPLTANVGALFRRQSIMRVVQTGNIALPLAWFSWIEELGSESPFTPIIVPGGIFFVGNDRQVHLLSEAGPVQIGEPIRERFIRSLSPEVLALLEAVYYPTTQECILTIPPEAEEE